MNKFIIGKYYLGRNYLSEPMLIKITNIRYESMIDYELIFGHDDDDIPSFSIGSAMYDEDWSELSEERVKILYEHSKHF